MGQGGTNMIDVADTNFWNEKFEEKEEKQKLTFANKIIMVGLILFGVCTTINTVLIYTFFNLLNKL